MELDFSCGGYEGLFRKALMNEINLFCGAGFSVEASDGNGDKLPLADGLLSELKIIFPDVRTYTKLSRACTKITKTDKASFYSFLRKRFRVGKFDPLYQSLLSLRLKNIYTTNIDDLFPKIYDTAEQPMYLNDRSQIGDVYSDSNAIHYYPLHGCIKTSENFVFGTTELASAFLQRGDSWQSLAKDAAHNSILFWGWNFDDPGPIAAMYGLNNDIEDNTNRWVLLHTANEETIDYLQSLKFNVIIGDTLSMLQYISDFSKEIPSNHCGINSSKISTNDLKKYQIPANDGNLPSYPFKAFFLDYTPRWSYIYSNAIPKTICYRKIENEISRGGNVIVIGIRCSSKTTLMMQLLVHFETDTLKHYMVAPSVEQAKSYIKCLQGRKSILFIDDCFRDTNAILELFKKSNIQVVGFDRDFNYERQYNKIQDFKFTRVDVSEITKEDAQSILEVIPTDLRRQKANNKNFDKDPTILTLLATNLNVGNFMFMDEFYRKDPDAARVFLMISYVHSCGTPCSFDMIYSFLGDKKYKWNDMFEIIHRIGQLISEISDDYLEYNFMDSIQDYYTCRSRFLAEKIIESIPKGNEIFSQVLFDFSQSVPIYKICMYDKFKRHAYDADFACRAFPDIEKGTEYYGLCAQKDESEYIYQQAALYFARIGQYKTAFYWIEKARNLSHYNRFSIDSTYAQIYFKANLCANREETEKALDILSKCCKDDKRKYIHFAAFAKYCLEFHEVYPGAVASSYIKEAISYINEGLDDRNLALSKKNKLGLRDLKRKLEKHVEADGICK